MDHLLCLLGLSRVPEIIQVVGVRCEVAVLQGVLMPAHKCYSVPPPLFLWQWDLFSFSFLLLPLTFWNGDLVTPVVPLSFMDKIVAGSCFAFMELVAASESCC